jgi:CheY-like chemotaxis protein
MTSDRPLPQPSLRTLFIIDDDPDVREVLTKLLIDYKVHSFPTGVKAVEWLQANPDAKPDFVMSDCVMPGLNGIETLKQIRCLAPAAKLVLMSAAVPEELERATIENNFDGFLANPFTATEGQTLIQDALSSKNTEVRK